VYPDHRGSLRARGLDAREGSREALGRRRSGRDPGKTGDEALARGSEDDGISEGKQRRQAGDEAQVLAG
jgi:hypothetical protein